MFPFAVLSDIHGNRWALEVVLEDIERRNIKQMVNLGDCLYGPLDPYGTAQLLLLLNMPTVSGNEDCIIYETPLNDSQDSTCQYVKNCLTDKEVIWLKNLKRIESIDDKILMFHGTFEDDHQYFLHDFNHGQIKLKDENKLIKLLQDRKETLILCGHDHTPNVVNIENDKVIVNPGSVGIQSYTDDIPVDHYVENGSPHARYSIIHQLDEDIYKIEQIILKYDFEKACEMARKNHREDWAYWLKTGRAY